MGGLLHQYFNIAFLMGKPQDLPGSAQQMQTGFVLALCTYVLALASSFGVLRAVLHALLDLGFSALVLYVALSAFSRQARFPQAYGGLCGATAFINLAAVPLYLGRGTGAADSMLAGLADFILLVWGISLLAHVIRHTFELRLASSVLVAFIYILVLVNLLALLLPTVQQADMNIDETAAVMMQLFAWV